MGGQTHPTGPDLRAGVPLTDIPDGGMLGGHVDDDAVIVARRGNELFALDGTCTHYGAPLAEGLIAGDTLRCPWHHACFDLRTGAQRAPALRPLGRWTVERVGDRVVVTGRRTSAGEPAAGNVDAARLDRRIVIVGGGAAGDAAAEMLRRVGHRGPLAIVGAEEASACDRPNLSKDYLAGNAPEDWIPLRAPSFHADLGIELLVGTTVTAIDRAARTVGTADGRSLPYEGLLIATGAAPVRLPPSIDPEKRALSLRTLADSRAIIAAAGSARRAAVIGASFIGLEVAASLRARGLEVHVIAPEAKPLERVLGAEVGDFIRSVHEANGVTFHLGRTVAAVDANGVTLGDGTRVDAELVVAGIGVRPNDELARSAGLVADRGITVDDRLTTSDPDIFAAGDVARYPDPRTGERIRIEHWMVAQRQGQCAALNLLGANRPFSDVPFFWSQHHDVTIGYVGHAERWDDVAIDGGLAERDCQVTYRAGGRTLAVATIGRDLALLEAELSIERQPAMAGGV